MDHPVELKNLFFTRSIVIAMADHVPNGPNSIQIAPVNSLEVKKIENVNDEYTVAMRVLFNQEGDSSVPYVIDMECIAIFKIDVNIDSAEIQKHLTITGHSVVYGAVREAVSWITSRQPYGSLNLGLSILKPQTKTEPIDKPI